MTKFPFVIILYVLFVVIFFCLPYEKSGYDTDWDSKSKLYRIIFRVVVSLTWPCWIVVLVIGAFWKGVKEVYNDLTK